MSLQMPRLLTVVLFFCFTVEIFASHSLKPISMQTAAAAFSTNSPMGKKQIYLQVEKHILGVKKSTPLRDAIAVLRKMAVSGNMVDRYESFCFDNVVSCSNEVLRGEFLSGFVRSPDVDLAPQRFTDRIDDMLSKVRNPSMGFRLAAAKAKADIFAFRMKDVDSGMKVLENFIDEAGTNDLMKISAMVKQLEIYRMAQDDRAAEVMAKKLHAMELCPDFAFTAAALALSDLSARKGDVSTAGHYLISILEKSVSVPNGFADRFVRIKTEKAVTESAIRLIRNRIAKVPLNDLKTFRLAVERWQPELIVLLTYLGKGEEAIAECRVLMFFSSGQRYQKSVELTAKTLKIADGNLGRSSAFINFQKKGIVPEHLNVMMEPSRLSDDVRNEHTKNLSVLQNDRWNDLLVYSQRLLWLDDPYGSVECALKAFSIAPFDAKSLQMCADAVVKPILSVTRDPSVAKAIVDYLMYGERGKDGVKGSGDDVGNPLDAWGDRLRTRMNP